MIRRIALNEFKLQRRNLVFWVVLVLLLIFLITEVVVSSSKNLSIAHSSTPVLWDLYGEVVDMSVEFSAALDTASFSERFGWLMYDRVLLLATLLMSLFSISVWERDKNHHVIALIHSRNVPAWKYVIGKFFGLMLTYGFQLMVIFAVAVISCGYLAGQWGELFSPLDVLSPFLGLGLISLIFSVSFTLFVSLVLSNSAAVFLIHFIYWVYCITKIGSFTNASRLNFLTLWMIRFDRAMDVDLPGILTQRMDDLLVNRGIYLAAAFVLLAASSWVYQHRSRHNEEKHR